MRLMKMPFELFLALRYLRPKRTFVSMISVLSLTGVLLGVMVLILVISVMSGFERDLRDKVLGFTAHITVTNYGILDNPIPIEKVLESQPGVLGISPFITGPVLVEFQNRISTPYVRGIDPEREKTILGIEKYVVQGEFFLEGDSAIIGARFAERNGVAVGDKLLVFSPKNVEDFRRSSTTGEHVAYLPTELMVTGIFSTGMFDYDSTFMLVNLETAQQLYNLRGGVHGIAMRVADPLKADEIKKRLNPLLTAPVQAYSWMDLNRQLFSAIAVERNVMFFLLLFIIVVAAFGLSSTLITITVQKSHEIGVLKALGASERQLLCVFLAYGWIVGLTGGLLGVGSGLFLLHYRNEAAQLLASTLGVEIFPYEIYQFASIPAEVSIQNIVTITISAVLLCTLAALIPAWNAARLQPARALRYE